jgi:hypothetical protein
VQDAILFACKLAVSTTQGWLSFSQASAKKDGARGAQIVEAKLVSSIL